MIVGISLTQTEMCLSFGHTAASRRGLDPFPSVSPVTDHEKSPCKVAPTCCDVPEAEAPPGRTAHLPEDRIIAPVQQEEHRNLFFMHKKGETLEFDRIEFNWLELH